MTIRLAIICGYIEIPTIFHLKMREGKGQRTACKTPQPIEAKQPDFESYEAMTKGRINSSAYPGTYHRGTIKKRLRSEGGWCGNSLQQQEYQVILELSRRVIRSNLLCDAMGINRSSFYYWKKMLSNPAPRTRALIENIQLFQEYHLKYPSHGYRWLNAKIRLDKGIEMY